MIHACHPVVTGASRISPAAIAPARADAGLLLSPSRGGRQRWVRPAGVERVDRGAGCDDLVDAIEDSTVELNVGRAEL